MRSRAFYRFLSTAAAAAAVCTFACPQADAKAKSKKSPVIGVVTEGIAERLHSVKKKGKKKGTDTGKTFTALCDGTLASWKVSDLGDDGAWVGGFVGGNKPKHCLLLDTPADPSMAAKGRPNATTAQTTAARSAAIAALTPKSGVAPTKVEVVVFNDGEGFVAVAQSTAQNSGKGNCLDHTSLVILSESEGGAWKSVFKPTAKVKDVCGYSFFTRGDIDGDGRDEIALRVDKGEGYGYRVLKRSKGSYSVIVK